MSAWGSGRSTRSIGRKAFPVHHTFFFGEMALFSFIILVLTGIYLGLIYVPSNAEVTINGQTLPEAYASTQLIESIPVANLFRNVHHWAAHLMVISILLHTIRIFFTGTYRKPREVNWVIGVVLLGLTLLAGFVGYSLPYDSYAVTATGIGYAIARSIPWVGRRPRNSSSAATSRPLESAPPLHHPRLRRARPDRADDEPAPPDRHQAEAFPAGLRQESRGAGAGAGRAAVAVPGAARRATAPPDVRGALYPLGDCSRRIRSMPTVRRGRARRR